MKDLFCGIILGTLISGCAGAAFNYHYYGLSLASYNGTLLGPTAADDKSFSLCANNGCVVMISSDFFQLKGDFMDTQNQLIACQKGN